MPNLIELKNKNFISLNDGDAVVYLNFMGGKQDEEAHVYGNSPLLINLGHTVKRGVGSPLDKKDSDFKSLQPGPLK